MVIVLFYPINHKTFWNMIPAIIALLLSLNLITSAAEWDTLSDSEQQELQEIVTEDINGV